jgi:hypothetical protein
MWFVNLKHFIDIFNVNYCIRNVQGIVLSPVILKTVNHLNKYTYRKFKQAEGFKMYTIMCPSHIGVRFILVFSFLSSTRTIIFFKTLIVIKIFISTNYNIKINK